MSEEEAKKFQASLRQAAEAEKGAGKDAGKDAGKERRQEKTSVMKRRQARKRRKAGLAGWPEPVWHPF